MSNKPNVGIVAYGKYIPETVLTAADISKATKGAWSEQAIIEKLGINKKSDTGRPG